MNQLIKSQTYRICKGLMCNPFPEEETVLETL